MATIATVTNTDQAARTIENAHKGLSEVQSGVAAGDRGIICDCGNVGMKNFSSHGKRMKSSRLITRTVAVNEAISNGSR